jgi:hypothetical protein
MNVNATMNQELKAGQQIRINGRTYTVEQEIPLSENIERQMPWLGGQYGIRGQRGSVGLMQLYRLGGGKVVWMTRTASRVEMFRRVE